MSIKTCLFCRSLMLCAINSAGSGTENLIEVVGLLNTVNMFMKSVCLLHCIWNALVQRKHVETLCVPVWTTPFQPSYISKGMLLN